MKHNPSSRDLALRLYQDNVSPRARALDILERYAEGRQYEGRPDWWNDEVPLRERAPCVVVPVGGRAAQSNVDLCLGEGRAPRFGFCASEDDSVFDSVLGLTEDDSALLTRFTAAAVKQAKALQGFQDALLRAQTIGTTCAVWSARRGKLCFDALDAKWCSPTFNADEPSEVESVEIRYPMLRESPGERGEIMTECVIFRRVIDAQRDVTYKPAPASKDGAEPDQWIEDKVIAHGLGFCPVLWWTFDQRHGIDGTAIHARMLDEIDAFNVALSQVHRAAITSTDPQVVETGVAEDEQVAPVARQANAYIPDHVSSVIIDPSTGRPWRQDDPANRQWVMDAQGRNVRGAGMARKRGPGSVWRYPDGESDVKLLTLPGDALTPAANNARTLYAILKEAIGVVFLDPEQTKLGSDISGRALEWLHSKQIDRCNMIRDRFGDGFIVPSLSMMLRLALQAGGSLFLPGLDKARAVLQRFHRQLAGVDGTTWFAPEIAITWGPYFAPTATDAKAEVETVAAAKDAGLITKRTAVEKIRPHFPDIGDVDQYMEALEEEGAEKMAAFHAAQKALTEAARGEQAEPAESAEGAEPASAPRPKVVPPPREPRAPKAKRPPVVRAKKRQRPQEEAAA